MGFIYLPLHRRLFETGLGGIAAAGCKSAALGDDGGIGHQTGDGLQTILAVLDVGQGVEQTLGIGVSGVAEYVGQRAPLHDAAGVHDRHLVTDLGNDAQIVGDHDHRGAVLGLQVLHQLQHLCLNGHIQCGGGLVGDEDLGIAGQSDGDNRAISQKTLEKLADGTVTLGVVYNLPSALEYDAIPYHQEKMYLVSAKDARLTVDGNKILGENGPPPMIQLDFGITINHLAEEIFYTLPRIMTTEHPLLQLHLISSGMGVGLLQESVAKVGMREGKISLVDCEYNTNPLLFQNYLAYSKKKKYQVEDLVSYLMENSPAKGTGEAETFPFPDAPVQWPVL